jgi:hypothetical protein
MMAHMTLIKDWIATNGFLCLSIVIGWGLAVWYHRKSVERVTSMGDSRFATFLNACYNVLRFYAFTLLTWIAYTSIWYTVRLVIFQHTKIAASTEVWQSVFDRSLAFAYDPRTYLIAFVVFLTCCMIGAATSALFYKRIHPEQKELTGSVFLETLLVIDLAVVLLIFCAIDRIT